MFKKIMFPLVLLATITFACPDIKYSTNGTIFNPHGWTVYSKADVSKHEYLTVKWTNEMGFESSSYAFVIFYNKCTKRYRLVHPDYDKITIIEGNLGNIVAHKRIAAN